MNSWEALGEFTPRVWEFLKNPSHAAAVMAIFTVAIFLATAVYAIVSVVLLRQTARSTEREQRSWVGVVAVTGALYSGSTTFSGKVRNTGKTPALEVVKMDYLWDGPTGQRPDFDYPIPANGSRGVIMPGCDIDFGNTRPLLPANVAAIQNGTFTLFVYGSVWYRDIFNKERRSDFCSQWNPAKNNFVPSPFHESMT